MLRLPIEQQYLIIVQTIGLVALCIRLWSGGLQRIYVCFFDYLLLALVQTAVLSFIPFNSESYAEAWIATEGVIVCFYALIVLECYSTVFHELPGIAGIGRRYIKITVVVVTCITLVIIVLGKQPTTMFQYFFLVERSLALSLVLLLFLMSAFLLYYPVPLKRNVVVYSIGYSLYFLTKAAGLFARSLEPGWSRTINTIGIAVSTSCLIFWCLALNRHGEVKTVVIGHRWNRDDEEQLLAQLKAINSSLLRTLRK